MIRKLIKRFGIRKLGLMFLDWLSFQIGLIISILIYYHGKISIDLYHLSYVVTIIYFIASVSSVISFRFDGLYKQRIAFSTFPQMKLLLKNVLLTFFIVLLLRYLIKPTDDESTSRIHLFIYVFLSYSIIFFNRLILLRLLDGGGIFSHIARRNILIIGAGDAGYNFANEIILHKNLGFRIVGFIDDKKEFLERHINGFQVLGTTDDIERITDQYSVDEVFIAVKSIDHDQLLSLIKKCRCANCAVNIISDHFGIIEKKVGEREFRDLRFVSLFSTSSSFYVRFFKRWFDLAIATMITVISFPFLAIIAILVAITSRGPIFYVPTSIGKNGKPFKFYKFRSMYVNQSNEKHVKLVEDFMNGKINGAKLRNDSRVTKIGRFLRRFSIDEFSQLINVFKGDMSLVGPRPSTTFEYEMMEEWHKHRFKATPGMTGLWQVSGRAEVSFIDMMVMDIYYVENCSLWLDTLILLKTIGVVFRGKGGY